MRISGNGPSSVILSQKRSVKVENSANKSNANVAKYARRMNLRGE